MTSPFHTPVWTRESSVISCRIRTQVKPWYNVWRRWTIFGGTCSASNVLHRAGQLTQSNADLKAVKIMILFHIWVSPQSAAEGKNLVKTASTWSESPLRTVPRSATKRRRVVTLPRWPELDDTRENSLKTVWKHTNSAIEGKMASESVDWFCYQFAYCNVFESEYCP